MRRTTALLGSLALGALLLACSAAPQIAQAERAPGLDQGSLPATGDADASDAPRPDFEGLWHTTYGPMFIERSGEEAHGLYEYQGTTGSIVGRIDDKTLRFTYTESSGVHGEGAFELSADGLTFSGTWSASSSDEWIGWNGTRVTPQAMQAGQVEGVPTPQGTGSAEFTGLYDTTYGRLRLLLDGDTLTGEYSGGGSLHGTVKNGRAAFSYQDTSGTGTGWFEVDHGQLKGAWEGATGDGASWEGMRVVGKPGVVWLVVLETHWEQSLADPEFAWGVMLDRYFARHAHVRVRQRRINDRTDFVRAARELVFLAEPVVLLVAGHGTEAGLVLDGESLGTDALAAALRPAPHVFLVHFGACDIMAGSIPDEVLSRIGEGRALSISGYGVPVEWAASAAVDLLFLDLVLGHGIRPADAARVLLEEVGFAGVAPAQKTSPWGALHFELRGDGGPVSDSASSSSLEPSSDVTTEPSEDPSKGLSE